MKRVLKRLLITGLLLISLNLATAQDVTVAHIFGDNMVLQRDQEVSVYGNATPSSEVMVAFNGQTKRTQADPSGSWQLKLAPMNKSFEPEELVVKSDKCEEPVVISNVVVGDVWLCSGQSNMERWFEAYPLLKSQAAEINNPGIRSIVMARRSFDEPDEVPEAQSTCSTSATRRPRKDASVCRLCLSPSSLKMEFLECLIFPRLPNSWMLLSCLCLQALH